MTHALVTFLGRTSKKDGGYQTTRYRFPDGSESEPSAFLGWTLTKRLCPDRLVVLGTSRSMWAFLGEQAGIAEGDGDMDELWESLEQAGDAGGVTETHLERLAPLVSGHVGVETRLRLIPNGVTEAEQLSVLQIMADATEGCTEVTLEVSHGFRHLPMIAVVAAVYLQAVRDVRVRDIWYGFYDPDEKSGTVHDLKGLLRLFDWVRALSQFEHGGDYGVFTTLLAAEGRTEFEAPLRKAAFFERTTRDGPAKESIGTVAGKLDGTPLTGVAGLFQSALEDRLAWVRKGSPQQRQRALASRYLEQRDYLRAVVYAFEAFITHLVYHEGKGNHASHKDREQAKNEYEAHEKEKKAETGSYSAAYLAYRELRDIRNALVHVSRPFDPKIKKAVKSEEELRKLISKFLDEFPDN